MNIDSVFDRYIKISDYLRIKDKQEAEKIIEAINLNTASNTDMYNLLEIIEWYETHVYECYPTTNSTITYNLMRQHSSFVRNLKKLWDN